MTWSIIFGGVALALICPILALLVTKKLESRKQQHA